MEQYIRVAGILLLMLAMIHTVFPRYFFWKENLKSLSLINRQMMTIHTFFIAIIVFLMGLLCLTSTTELIQTPLGKTISSGFGIFWFVRLVVQFVGYSPELWRGKKFETAVHIILSVFWVYLTVVFFVNALS